MPEHAPNLRPWQIRDSFSLYEAAVLWSEQDPGAGQPAPGYKVIAEAMSQSIDSGELEADVEREAIEVEDPVGGPELRWIIDWDKTRVSRAALAAWARNRRPQPTFLADDLSAVPAASNLSTREGRYTTRALDLMERAIVRFWEGPDAIPGTSEVIVEWLKSQGASRLVAEGIDRIIRSDNHPHRPRRDRG